ncbi:transposase [Lactococcus hodotermopsidis]|uniref:Transposase n=2 Tax=Pseudolactococcus hodotermopsidis TaxID=2709157 RepID=A0A6A0BEL5_9LACT|nr:ISNCY family transposase [Lactococcus hodotermopsidis]GFH43135.1 transposase [Lactococcus hodotermopsidis]
MNELKKYRVIKLVHDGKKKKQRASVELGLSLRQVNRLLKAYQEKGKQAFVHGNRGMRPAHAISFEIKEKIIKHYKAYQDLTPNIKHFTEILAEIEDIHYSDTTIRAIIYSDGLLSPKSQRKTRRRIKALRKKKESQTQETALLHKAEERLEVVEKAHPSRPRKKYSGELIQMDASSYQWFGGQITHLHVAIDDASGNIVGAYFDTQETLKGYYHVLHQILTKHGIPVTFLTDKRTVFEYHAKARKKMEDDTLTQFGFACHQLGIEVKTSSIPQAKGRVERLNGTLQSRLPIDLQRAGITTIEDANDFLNKWVRQFNQKFGNKTKETVFEQAPSDSTINLLLARVAKRVVDSGHHIRYNNHFYLPIKGDKEMYFTKKSKALVIEAFDGNIYINIEDKIYSSRMLLTHEIYSEEFDQPKEGKKEKRKYIPQQSHPWKLASFEKYLRRIGKTLLEYQAENSA